MFALFVHRISCFFRHRCSHRFVHRFFMENGSRIVPDYRWGTSLFSFLFATFSEERSYLRSAHTRRPAYTFRQNSLRHLTFETPFPRFYRAQKTGGVNGACAPFGGRRARCARARGARAARAQLGGMGPWGPLGLFRSHSEWKAISNGKYGK